MPPCIVSGIKLQDNPTLHYLFYLAQIGLAMCPISNDALFLKLNKSPVGTMFKQGLNISFGTVRANSFFPLMCERER